MSDLSLEYQKKLISPLVYEIVRLAEALGYAVSIIESYEMDIRNAKDIIGIDLIEKGFCQGTIYKNAIKKIEKTERGE